MREKRCICTTPYDRREEDGNWVCVNCGLIDRSTVRDRLSPYRYHSRNAVLEHTGNITELAEYSSLIAENLRLRYEIAHARKELWMPDEEDETFLQGVEGVHFRIIGLLNEVKNLEYRVRELERTTPPAPSA